MKTIILNIPILLVLILHLNATAASFEGQSTPNTKYHPWLEGKEGVQTSIDMSWKLWTLLGEPVHSCVAKWDKVNEVHLIPNSESQLTRYSSTELVSSKYYIPQEVLDKIRIYNVKTVSSITTGLRNTPKFSCDLGVMALSGDKESYNTPSSRSWNKTFFNNQKFLNEFKFLLSPVSQDEWQYFADDTGHYISEYDARNWFKGLDSSWPNTPIELSNTKIVTIQYDLSPARLWINQNSTATAISTVVTEALTKHFENLENNYNLNTQKLKQKLKIINSIKNNIERMKKLNKVYASFVSKKITPKKATQEVINNFEQIRSSIDSSHKRQIKKITMEVKRVKKAALAEQSRADIQIKNAKSKIMNRPNLKYIETSSWTMATVLYTDRRNSSSYYFRERIIENLESYHATLRSGEYEIPIVEILEYKGASKYQGHYTVEVSYRWKVEDDKRLKKDVTIDLYSKYYYSRDDAQDAFSTCQERLDIKLKEGRGDDYRSLRTPHLAVKEDTCKCKIESDIVFQRDYYHYRKICKALVTKWFDEDFYERTISEQEKSDFDRTYIIR